MPNPQNSGPATTVPFSSNALINALLFSNPTKWGGTVGSGVTLTYSFPWQNGQQAYWGADYGNEITATERFGFNSIQIAGAKEALQRWADVADLKFVEVADTSTNVGDIRFAFSSAVGDWWGWASGPNNYWARAGDIWVTPNVKNDQKWSAGSYDFQALMHEIGHALGLDHSFDGPYTIQGGLDYRNYTIMSYTDPANVYYNGSYTIKTPMVYDILAIQYLYGANKSFRSGNDSYILNSSEAVFQTIWDAGGTDEIDISSLTTNTRIDMRDGAYSSIPIVGWNAENNFGIAFGAIIENLRGGSGSDRVTGNSAANTIWGNAGNDIIDGGLGTDIASYRGKRADYNVTRNNDGSYSVEDRTPNRDGTDLLISIERLQFSDQSISISDASSSTWFLDSDDVRIVAATWQFFMGTIPTKEGFEYYIQSSSNITDLNDPYFSKFNEENKYTAFSSNLAFESAQGIARFKATYSGLDYEATLNKAFEIIITSKAVVNPEDSKAFFRSSKSYFEQVAIERIVRPGVDLTEATKLALVSSMIYEAVRTNSGPLAKAVNAFAAEIVKSGDSTLFNKSILGNIPFPLVYDATYDPGNGSTLLNETAPTLTSLDVNVSSALLNEFFFL